MTLLENLKRQAEIQGQGCKPIKIGYNVRKQVNIGLYASVFKTIKEAHSFLDGLFEREEVIHNSIYIAGV